MGNVSLKIGKIIEISNSQIKVAINREMDTPYKVVDGELIRVGGVSNFVKVGSKVYEIINEKVLLDSENDKEIKRINSQKYLICNISGYIKEGRFYQGSNGEVPNIFENVYSITDYELEQIYTGTIQEESISVGTFLFNDSLDFNIDINSFFASHTLIVGNTGSGKSNTLNTIYSELFNDRDVTKSLFLIIDTNGEYKDAFTNRKVVKRLDTSFEDSNEINIPIQLLDAEDWKLLLEATDKTQYPIIKKVCNTLRRELFEAGKYKKSISVLILDYLKVCMCGIINSNNTPANKLNSLNSLRDDMTYYSDELYKKISESLSYIDKIQINNNRLNYIGDIYEDRSNEIIGEINKIDISLKKEEFTVEDFGFLLELEHIFRKNKYSTNENNTSPMIARFNSSKKDFGRIFIPYKDGEDSDIESTLFEKHNVLVCDVSSAKKDIRRIIVTFICSKLYSQFMGRTNARKSLHLIIDEAHNYLSSQNLDKEDAIAKTCIETFENIIKEGRKFSVFLTMSTQRPSDISGTLISQAHNYIIHKLVNPNDINIIKNAVPFIDEMSMEMLKILTSGQAIFSGTAFNRPNIVKVKFDEKNTKVNSGTIKLTSFWNKEEIVAKEIDESVVADIK